MHELSDAVLPPQREMRILRDGMKANSTRIIAAKTKSGGLKRPDIVMIENGDIAFCKCRHVNVMPAIADSGSYNSRN